MTEGFMGWFRRRRIPEVRAIETLPWNYGGDRPAAITQERALHLGPVYAAVRHLCDNISTLPVQAYRKIGDQRQPMSSLPQLLQFMDEDGTLVDWISMAIASLATQGDAIGLILARDGFDFPTVVQWRPRSEFYVDESTNPLRAQWYWNGRKIERADVVHIPWLTVPGRTLGLSPIEAFALTVGVGLGTQEYGSTWFNSGGFPPGTFENSEQTVGVEESNEIRARLTSSIRRREPLVYGRDWKYSPISVPPEQAQFVETQRLTANQIAAIFGIEPTEIGGEAANSQEYSNPEGKQTTQAYDLQPWVVRFENGISGVLPERQFMRLNADARIRADLKTRWEVHEIRRRIGATNIDEIRATEDQPPLPNGQGQDYTPLGKSEPNQQDALETPPERALRAIGS